MTATTLGALAANRYRSAPRLTLDAGLLLADFGPGLETVEDVIVHELMASRFQDLGDIEAILASKPEFDEAYVERWPECWNVTATWRQLRTPGG